MSISQSIASLGIFALLMCPPSPQRIENPIRRDGQADEADPMASYSALAMAGATPTDRTSPSAFAPIGPTGSTTCRRWEGSIG